MSTLATMQTNVAGSLGLNVTDDGSRITGWLNDAVIDMLLRTHAYVTTTTMTLVAGQGDYTLDSGILAIEEMYITSGATQTRFRPVDSGTLTEMRLNATPASPAVYYTVFGSTTLAVYPTPAAADVVTIYYVPRPTVMSGNSNDPSTTTYGGIPSEFHYGLELYAMWKAGDYSDDASSSQGERYRAEYEGPDGNGGFLRKMKTQIRNKTGVRMQRARVAAWRRPIVVHDRSTYGPYWPV